MNSGRDTSSPYQDDSSNGANIAPHDDEHGLLCKQEIVCAPPFTRFLGLCFHLPHFQEPTFCLLLIHVELRSQEGCPLCMPTPTVGSREARTPTRNIPQWYLHPEFWARNSHSNRSSTQYRLYLLGSRDKSAADKRQMQGHLRYDEGNNERWRNGEQIDLLIID
jgi:hypothetical protein